MKREVIFEMPKTFGVYRMVCRFGYDSFVSYAWWGHLQKQYSYRFWPWGKKRFKWYEVDSCWWSKEITTMEDLKKRAESFYDKNVELFHRLRQRAIDLK
jgi:hypothetical protein